MPHEDYEPGSLVPTPAAPDYSFDPASLYDPRTRPSPAAAEPPPAPGPLPARVAKTALAVALVGAVGLVFGNHQLARATAARAWMETRADIASAQIRSTPQGAYRLDLVYRYRAYRYGYQAGVQTYQGSRIALDPDTSREAAYAQAARFRPGARVPAWFDPTAPSSVLLERPDPAAPRLITNASGVLFLAGLAPFALQWLRLARHKLALRRLDPA